MARYTEKREFAKDALVFLTGSGLGVVVNKLVIDGFTAAGIPNPALGTVQTTDFFVAGGELLSAFYANKKGKPLAGKFMVGMASGVVATDVVNALAPSGSTVKSAATMNVFSGVGKYNRTAPIQQTGYVGGYLKIAPMAYPRR